MATRIERINLITEFNAKGAEKYKQQVQGAGKEVSTLGGIVRRAAGVLGGLFAIGGVAAATKSIIGMAAAYETTAQSIEVFVGSAEAARQIMQDLTDFAVQTPFEQDEVIQAGKTLLAFGTQAEDVIGIVNNLGQAAAASGTSIANLAFVFGQVRAQGKAQLQDLYQFVNAGVPIFELLADSMGRNVSEIRKLTSAGQITSRVLEDAFKKAAEEGGRFNGALLRQAATLSGITSTLKDEVANTAREIGTALLPRFKALAQGALDFIRTLDTKKIVDFVLGVVDFVKEIAPLIGVLARATAGYLAYKTALEITTAAQKLFNTAAKANPIGILVSAIAVLLPEMIDLARVLTGTTKEMRELRDISASVSKEFRKEAAEADELFNTLQDLNSTTKERSEALDALTQAYPEVLANYDLEKGSLEDIRKAQDDVNKSIIQGIESRLLESAVDRFNEAREKVFKELADGPGFVELVLYGPRAGQAGLSKAEKELSGLDAAFKSTRDSIKRQAEQIGRDIFGIPSTPFGNPLIDQVLNQEELNTSIQRGIKLRDELSKLSTDELRVRLSIADIDRQTKSTILEIIAERKRSAAALAGELQAAIGSLAALETQLKTLEERISKTAPGNPVLETLIDQSNIIESRIRDVKDLIDSLKDPDTFFLGGLENTIEEIDALNEALRKVEENRLAAEQGRQGIDAEEGADRLQAERLQSETETARQVRDARRQLLKDLQGLEANDFDEREQAYREFQGRILQIQIEQAEIRRQQALESGDALGFFEAQAELEDLQIQQLENSLGAVDKFKQAFSDASDFIVDQILPIVDSLSQVTQALEDSAARAYEIQEKRVEDARELAERGNAELLQLEEERLREIEERRRRSAQVTRELAAIEFAANVAAGIAKAFATEGPLFPVLAPVLIAALAGGIAQAQALAQGFKEGTEYVKGERGIDKIPAWLTHGERVVDADTNKQMASFPNEKLPEAVNLYKVFSKLPVVKQDLYREEQTQFDKLEKTMNGLRRDLQSLKMHMRVDEFGIHAGISNVDRYLSETARLMDV